jgi:hypothetical protein
MFQSLEDLYTNYFNQDLPFTHLMADADQGTRAMFEELYSRTYRTQLMCYWHLLQAVSKHFILYKLFY